MTAPKTAQPAWMEAWNEALGEAVNLAPDPVALKWAIVVDRRFYDTVLRTALVRLGQDFTPANVNTFAQAAVEAAIRRQREAPHPLSREEVGRAKRLIPSPTQRSRGARITIDLEGRIQAGGFTRLLARCTEASPWGRRVFCRVALLEAIEEALRRQAPALVHERTPEVSGDAAPAA